MIRPYFALIRDSFREALVSWTLWILFIPITLFLLAIAPLQLVERVPTSFHWRDIRRPIAVAQTMRNDRDRKPATPAGHVWKALPKDVQKRIDEQFGNEDEDGVTGEYRLAMTLAGGLSALLDDVDLYDREVWSRADVDANDELKSLLEKPGAQLRAEELARRNRLLIEAAFPRAFRQRRHDVAVTYFGAELFGRIPYPRDTLMKIVRELVVPAVLSFFVGVVGVLIAVFVTAPIVPRLFDEGSLHLLLSKPVIRSVAFLSKYLGGCAFILLGASYFVTGLWLILGTRFGIWNQGLLWSIPIFMFIFAVYYSISAFAGAVWRNTIVAIAAVVLFWMMGFGVGQTYSVYQALAIQPAMSSEIVAAPDAVFRMTRAGGIERWVDQRAAWEVVAEGSFAGINGAHSGRFVARDGGVFLAIERIGRGHLFGRPKLLVATPANDWQVLDGPRLPKGAFRLLPTPDGRILVAASDNLFELKRWDTDHAGDNGLLGGTIDLGSLLGNSSVKAIGPAGGWKLQGPSAAAIDSRSGTVVVYDAGELMRFEPQANGRYRLADQKRLVEESDAGADLAVAGDTVIVITADGLLFEVDRTSLAPRRTVELEPTTQPRQVVASPTQPLFAIQFHNGTVHLLKRGDGRTSVERPGWLPQRKISAVEFTADGELLVGRRHRSVVRYDVEHGRRIRAWDPPLALSEKIFFYGVRPLRWIIPAPGDLKQTAHYFMSGKETVEAGESRADIRTPRPQIDPWGPVWQSGIFLAVVLALACLYVERQDF